MTTLAKQLPDSSSFPRYVAVGQSVTDCKADSRGKSVRLSTRCWISTARWNEIAGTVDTVEAAKQIALVEAHANRVAGKAQYAAIVTRLDEIDNPGFQSRRAALAVHAAQVAAKEVK